jgi:dihydroxyacetone kinase-like predicted kinase
VARTPSLLPVLREAGVVDAGGQGLYVLLDGALQFLKGESQKIQYRRPRLVAAEPELVPRVALMPTQLETPHGYCTNFVLEGKNLNLSKIEKDLKKKGQSLIVTGDDNLVRVHIHSFEPGEILKYATKWGKLHEITINNMDDQYAQFIKMQRERMPQVDIAMVAVATGDGFFKLLNSLGNIIIVVSAASQIHSLTSKKVQVVPTRNIPQGIAAFLAFDYDMGLEENAQVMEKVISRVKAVEVTRAMRGTRLNSLEIKKGQFIAILNDEDLIARADKISDVIMEALGKAGAEKAGIVTVYYGAEIKDAEAQEIAQEVRDRYHTEVEVVYGGQPHYNYIISLE